MHRSLAAILALALASVTLVAHGEGYDGPRRSARIDGAYKPRAMPPEGPMLGPDASCEALYGEINRLLPHADDTRPPFTANPVNGVIGALGTVFPAAWLLYAVPIYADLAEQREIDALRNRIDTLRGYSAARQCWVQ